MTFVKDFRKNSLFCEGGRLDWYQKLFFFSQVYFKRNRLNGLSTIELTCRNIWLSIWRKENNLKECNEGKTIFLFIFHEGLFISLVILWKQAAAVSVRKGVPRNFAKFTGVLLQNTSGRLLLILVKILNKCYIWLSAFLKKTTSKTTEI